MDRSALSHAASRPTPGGGLPEPPVAKDHAAFVGNDPVDMLG